MAKFIAIFQFIDRMLNAVMKPIVVILSLLVAGMLALGIFTRAVLNAPMFGLEELVLMCVMWLYMLGAALASRERSHLSADFVQVLTHNPKVINFMHLLATSISLLMALYFVSWSYDLLAWGVKKQQTTPVFHIPWYVSQGSLFCASLLFLFYLLRDLVHDLISLLPRCYQTDDKALTDFRKVES